MADLAFVPCGEVAGQAVQVHASLQRPRRRAAAPARRRSCRSGRRRCRRWPCRGSGGLMNTSHPASRPASGAPSARRRHGARREIARDFEPARLHLVRRHADEPRHLAGMRRDDHVAPFASGSRSGSPTNAFRPRHRRRAASSARSTSRLTKRVAVAWPRPGPMATTSRANR